jgi:hypothetical protein
MCPWCQKDKTIQIFQKTLYKYPKSKLFTSIENQNYNDGRSNTGKCVMVL